ncbi:histone H1 [Pedobacter cryoconitis]|uniref:histone H1 n=1 Tax=Pedobacter cryoconitis TaxID=188932 RepID=UPI001612C648|nr:histone H1 [Pedobacter cryoconitis]MBB5645763.1 hypothetical protein [Pedobacter cryoconitis]
MENFKVLKELVLSLEKDANAFFTKGNKTAGTRLRIALQKSKSLAQNIRNEVSAKKNSK